MQVFHDLTPGTEGAPGTLTGEFGPQDGGESSSTQTQTSVWAPGRPHTGREHFNPDRVVCTTPFKLEYFATLGIKVLLKMNPEESTREFTEGVRKVFLRKVSWKQDKTNP